jgi:beta-N-acetylhexosaminidase
MGAELSALGIDLNLAPVVDVVTNGQNSDIAERAYSSQTQRAAELGPAFIQAIRQAGLRSCAKHWPGYGPIGRNPHEDLVHANTSEAEWGRTHMPPFWAAIRAGTDCVMVGHVIYDFLPSGKPASIDPQVYAMLRRAPFDGAVLTDDLEMGGVSRLYGDNFAKVAVDAVRAGADMVLICHTPSRAVAAHRALVKAATAGKLDLQEHAARIDALRLAR